MNRDPQLAAARFQVSGGIGLDWTLWPEKLAAIDPPPGVLLLHGHSDRITKILTSADGSKWITASQDSTIKIWRSRDPTLLHTLAPHIIGVTAMAMSPDGAKLASGDGSGLILLTSLEKLSPRGFSGQRPHENGIDSIIFLPDAPRFVSLDTGGKAVLWDASGAEPKPKRLVDGANAIACAEGRIAVAVRAEGPLGTILLFREDGTPLPPIEGTAGLVRSGTLAMRGNLLAFGDNLGHASLWDLPTGVRLHRWQLEGPTSVVDLWADGRAVIGVEKTLYVTSPNGPPTPLGLPASIAGVSLSPDGRSLAACTNAGDSRAWMIADGKIIQANLEEGARTGRTTSVAFTPQGDRLLSGDQDGGVRSWGWPEGGPPARIAPHRGKVDGLAVSNDGRTLLLIDHDRRARLMDLREGRSLRPIPGKWTGAAFLNDGLAMTRGDGSLRVVDAATGATRPIAFERPLGRNGAPISWGFQLVSASPDGKKVAAASTKGPLACVWDARGGPLLKVIRDQGDKVAALAFAADSRHLLVAGVDGSTTIWDVEGDQQTPRWKLRDEEAGRSGISSAAIHFGAKKRVATGSRDGHLVLWELREDGSARMVALGRFEGEIRALAFTPDGRNLLAGGDDKTTRLWNLAGDAPFPPGTRLNPQHSEQVNAAVALPQGRVLVSASSDSTLRFWATDPATLLGTLTADADSGRWVAFTQDGRFDSSPGGETQVAWVRGDRVFPLEQFADRSRIFGLVDLWLGGKMPAARSPISEARLPAIALDPPADPARDEVTITLRLGEDRDKLEGLRLYRNDMPVKDSDDFQATADPKTLHVRVGLGPGENRLYAMAARREVGSLQGRSNVVAVNGPDAPRGVLHVLALGVSKYDDSPLQFADRDAASLADFLRKNGFPSGGDGDHTRVLINQDVSPDAVELALLKMKNEVQPADTVVVFLAGHTDVRRDGRYCLLLAKFPLKPGTIPPHVRGPLDKQLGAKIVDNPGTILPFTTIERILARTNVANRMVVIDACQAEAIFDDPGVRRIREKTVDDAAHKLRTSYLLASRRGEGAKEAAVLKHGVLTHLLLRGMGAGGLEPEPGGALGNADLDGDGIVTSEELRGFIDAHLRELTSLVDDRKMRANPGRGAFEAPSKTDTPRVGSAATAFPLSRLPGSKD